MEFGTKEQKKRIEKNHSPKKGIKKGNPINMEFDKKKVIEKTNRSPSRA
jgi:hypothetical protein